MPDVDIHVVQLDRELDLPAYAHPGDAGADLRSTEDFELAPGERRVVGTGIAIALPEGYAGFVHPRSGLAARHGISIVNAPGTVDAGYRGEIKVCLVNTDRQVAVRFRRGDRIAQLVVQPVSTARFVPVSALDETVRGISGYGSTGGIPGRARRRWEPMIFKRKKRQAEAAAAEAEEPTTTSESETDTDESTVDEPTSSDETTETAEVEEDWTALDEQDWREEGPWDISEVDDVSGSVEEPRIDLGSMIIAGVPGSELRLQIAEETQQIVSAMLIMETIVEAPAGTTPRVQSYSSGLEIGAFAAPRSGGLWSELREELSASAIEAGGTASLGEGPFGVELRRLIPVTTPEGEEGYQPSRMWVAEGPRWLLRGIVYGQAAIEEDPDSAVVADVASAFRQVVVRRGDEAMAPGDLLPLQMPTDLVADESE